MFPIELEKMNEIARIDVDKIVEIYKNYTTYCDNVKDIEHSTITIYGKNKTLVIMTYMFEGVPLITVSVQENFITVTNVITEEMFEKIKSVMKFECVKVDQWIPKDIVTINTKGIVEFMREFSEYFVDGSILVNRLDFNYDPQQKRLEFFINLVSGNLQVKMEDNVITLLNIDDDIELTNVALTPEEYVEFLVSIVTIMDYIYDNQDKVIFTGYVHSNYKEVRDELVGEIYGL